MQFESRGVERAAASERWRDPELSSGLVRLMDSMGMALLLVQRDVVLLASERAGELLGVSARALEGPADALPEPAAAIVASAANARRGQRERVHVTLDDGREREIGLTVERASGSRDAADGAVLVAFQDLTPLHELQEQRDRLLKLATVGEVLPSLLHELKNPFAAIATSVELLIEESENPRVQEDLHAILVEVRRAVLSLDGIGFVGRDLRSKSPMALDHAVREACNLLGARAARARVSLDCDAPPLPLLPLDAAVVRALVFNLVNNAIQASSAGGHVNVSCGLANGSFTLKVQDDGCGMSPEVLARCTELFFTTKRAGSGIGLALCRKVAEEAGGRLDIESTEGVGTSTELRVPVSAASRG